MFDEYRQQRREEKSMAIGAGIALMILIGCWDTCSLVYRSMFATKTTAEVISVEAVNAGKGKQNLAVQFRYRDAGGARHTEREDFSIRSSITVGQEVPIQYYEGQKESARFVGESLPLTVYIFIVAVLLAIGWIVMVAREANA